MHVVIHVVYVGGDSIYISAYTYVRGFQRQREAEACLCVPFSLVRSMIIQKRLDPSRREFMRETAAVAVRSYRPIISWHIECRYVENEWKLVEMAVELPS